MAETKTPGDKTLSVGSKTLSLKPRAETGVVRQSFSHGRTKQVVVEKKPKRRLHGEAPVVETKPAAAAPTPARAAPALHRRPPRSRKLQHRHGQRRRRPVAHADRRGAQCACKRACRFEGSRSRRAHRSPKRKPHAARPARAPNAPSVMRPKPARRLRTSAAATTRKPRRRPNWKPTKRFGDRRGEIRRPHAPPWRRLPHARRCRCHRSRRGRRSACYPPARQPRAARNASEGRHHAPGG